MSSKRESMWERRSVRRELLIRIPISTVSMVGTVASASDKIWLGLMSMLTQHKGSRIRDFLSCQDDEAFGITLEFDFNCNDSGLSSRIARFGV